MTNFWHCHLLHPSISHWRIWVIYIDKDVAPSVCLPCCSWRQSQHSPYWFMDALLSVSICSQSSITSLGVTEVNFPGQEIRIKYTSNVPQMHLFSEEQVCLISSVLWDTFHLGSNHRFVNMWIFPCFQLRYLQRWLFRQPTYFTQSQYNCWHQLI